MNRLFSRLGYTALAIVASQTLMAQQTFGAFKGRVTDKATGAPKAGVVITIENQTTGYTRTSTSASDGTFRFPVVALGNYKILFKSSDATASMIRTSLLGAETDASVAMASAAGAVVTVVATSDTVDQVNTTSAEVGVNVSSERLVSLPVLTRNVVSAAVLAPGVQLVQGSNVDPTKKSSTYMTTGEGQGRGTNFNIDGGDNNSTDVGGYVSPIPLDAIGEFQVVTNQYKAEFGRSNAGFLNVVSKSGSNTFSGVVSGQFTNQSLRARSTDEGVQKDNSSRTLAALASGPIIKDKLFYMVSVERKDDEGAAFTFTPQAVAAFPALGSIKTKLKESIAYLRLDWAASQAVNATLTYSYDKNETPFQAFPHTSLANGNVDPGMLGNGLNKTNRYGLKVTTQFTPSFIWESNLVYFDYNNGISPNTGLGQGTPLQVRTRSSLNYSISSSKIGRIGADPNANQNTGIKRLQWRNDFTYIAGDHLFKGGLDYQKSTYADQQLFWPETGIYAMRVAGLPFGPGVFDPSVTQTNVTGVLLVANGFQQGQTYKQFGFYAQDDWTISPKLSVYLGIRADKDDIFDFLTPYQGLYTQVNAANPELLNGSTVPKNKTYISPRLQAVYKPRGDDSITFKVGYGKFIAGLIDNVTGFSRALGNKANGISGQTIDNNAALTQWGAGSWGGDAVNSFSAGTVLTHVNGHDVVLPVDLTP
jgi:outer membrane receptor for ferrienterochelin and colicin